MEKRLSLFKILKLKEGYLIVSDEMIKENEYVYHSEVSQEFTIVNLLKEGDERYSKGQHIAEGVYKHKPTTNTWYKKERKIIASTFIPELPNIDFNNLEKKFSIVDVEKLKDSWYNTQKNKSESYLFQYNEMVNDALEAGIKIGLELNKDKLYTEKDLKKAIKLAQNYTCDVQYDDNEIMHEILKHTHSESMIIQSLQPKTEWDIKIEMETKCYCGHTSHCECEEIEGKPFIQRPRLNNNQIKILKIK
jgi:hypothetical protein